MQKWRDVLQRARRSEESIDVTLNYESVYDCPTLTYWRLSEALGSPEAAVLMTLCSSKMSSSPTCLMKNCLKRSWLVMRKTFKVELPRSSSQFLKPAMLDSGGGKIDFAPLKLYLTDESLSALAYFRGCLGGCLASSSVDIKSCMLLICSHWCRSFICFSYLLENILFLPKASTNFKFSR